ncbi:MAG: DoxX family protein [Planctomycetota bacterium]
MQHKKKALIDLALLLTRVAIGVYLALAGVGKVRGELNQGVGHFYRGDFKGLQPGWLPDALAAPYGYALPWAEVVVGALLVLGLFSTVMAALTALMVLSFTIALAMKFGPSAQPGGSGGPFSANYITTAAAFLLACVGPGRLSIDHLWRGRKASGG